MIFGRFLQLGSVAALPEQLPLKASGRQAIG